MSQILVPLLIVGGLAFTALAVYDISWAVRQIADFLKRRRWAAPDPSTRISA